MTERYEETHKKQWRDVLPIHPAAELLPLMSPEGQRNLGHDIKVNNGLKARVIIHIDADGRRSLLDGRNRLDGMEYVGLPVLKNGTLDPDIFQEISGDPVAYVLSANLHRRHLSTKDKRELAGNLLKRMPEKSDRQIAELVCISHNTVKSVRDELIRCGQIDHIPNRLDKTGRRCQPATKPLRKEAKTDTAKIENTTAGSDLVATAETRKAQYAAQEAADHATAGDGISDLSCGAAGREELDDQDRAGGDSRGDGADLLGVAHDLPSAPTSPTGASVAAAFGRLDDAGVSYFLDHIPPTHRRMLKHALGPDHSSDDINTEIAKLAREAAALLTHAEHNKNDIHERLARIMALTDPDKTFQKINGIGKSNATIDPTLFRKAVGLEARTK
jgi:hypothetical protein